jgi:hypothetical protein
MANTAISIPFYISKDGAALTGQAAEMNFENLFTVDSVDKLAAAPAIQEIGGGWYKFDVAYGVSPFDSGDLTGVIDADKDGVNGLTDTERYVPVQVKLAYYAPLRQVCNMSQDKITGDMSVKNASGQTIIKFAFTEDDDSISRLPGEAS